MTACSFHLTGTNFLEEIENADFMSTMDVWSQDYVSENAAVYRAEYLAYQMLLSYDRNAAGTGSASEGPSPVRRRTHRRRPKSSCRLVIWKAT